MRLNKMGLFCLLTVYLLALGLTLGGLTLLGLVPMVTICSPNDEFTAIMEKRSEAWVASISDNDAGALILDDPDGGHYFTNVIRDAKRAPPVDGVLQFAKIKLSSGNSLKIGLIIPDQGSALTLVFPFANDRDPSFFLLELRKPIPHSVVQAIASFRARADVGKKAGEEKGSAYFIRCPSHLQKAFGV
jgi:hypothetical protein